MFHGFAGSSASSGPGRQLHSTEDKTEVESKESKQVSFVGLINDARFSDVQVVVGSEETVYSLHRNFLAYRSNFFSRVLDPKWKESKDGMVRLPEIHPLAFLAVLTWIYGGAFSITGHTEYLAEIYKAVDYLQIPDFKGYFFEQLISAVAKDSPTSTRRAATQCIIPNAFTLLGKFLAVAPETDHPTLQQLAITLTAFFEVPWEEIHPFMAQESEAVNAKVLFYMVAVGLDVSDGKKDIPAVLGGPDILRGLAKGKAKGEVLSSVSSSFGGARTIYR
ncbi:BTB (POZ) domain containing 19 [Orbilia oligospora]|uniref:BTB (POZ) domain containing 19 n=1 Tax=Orbilia oligospora TaxID=2813651 RepID=A0A6G1M9H8_ORBOL|nr:BTB (POZ) domain containing 19 [Orbilia oligospora]KAF3198543.1 BTB (POZ) domain containing 19 [Orbilia oligospora]KAF3228697.1 BTB (POZ) domain containing 19 [Orbilia oligospora]KAF3230775.1 BTB (POZ) domain containing 19 [Orbilia oligospora]KAF3250316.1 BTB (POZ) domain containing 19 [Orbilia oligospora]